MFKLTIKNEDDSIYWVECADTLGILEAWLLKEQAQPYWSTSFVTEIIDLAPVLPTQSEYDLALADCLENRRLEYPSAVVYMDGLVKNSSTQMQSYIDQCLAVKAKYPKPVRE